MNQYINANLALNNIRLQVKSLLRAIEYESDLDPSDVQELLENFCALDDSLTTGGFLPASWNPQK